MELAVIGATGRVGSRIVDEALRRGHWVTGICRHPESLPRNDALTPEACDLFDVEGMVRILHGHDVAVSAVRFLDSDPRPLVAAVKRARVPRYIVVGGAGSLETESGDDLVDSPDFPREYLAEALKGREFLNFLRREEGLDWTFLCPSAVMEPGRRIGNYRTGTDRLLVAPDGTSSISMEDFAVALVDEVEEPRHRGERFTVGY